MTVDAVLAVDIVLAVEMVLAVEPVLTVVEADVVEDGVGIVAGIRQAADARSDRRCVRRKGSESEPVIEFNMYNLPVVASWLYKTSLAPNAIWEYTLTG